MNKSLVIISIPRTGTNFLCGLINSLQEFEFFYEAYHRDTVYIPYHRKLEVIDYIAKQKNINLNIGEKDFEDSDLVKFAQEFPDIFWQSMKNTSTSKYFGLKIFMHHLALENLQQLFLNNKNITKLIIERNFLETYTSLKIFNEKYIQKATEDTSSFKVNFEPQHFNQWLTQVHEFYSFIENLANQSPQEYLRLTYEEIHQHKTNEKKVEYIVDFLQKGGFEIDAKQKFKTQYFIGKQDARKNLLNKYNNPERVIEFINDRQKNTQGIIYYRNQKTNNDRWICEHIFPGEYNKYFIEAGACNGVEQSSCYVLEKYFQWRGICIEPNDNYYEQLIKNRQNSICENVCLADINGKVKYVEGNKDSVHPMLGGIKSNIIQYKANNKEILEQGREVEKNSRTLPFLLAKHNFPKIIHYLAMDIEGSELPALEVFPFEEYTILAISIEGDKCNDLLLSKGYILVDNPFNTDSNFEQYFLHSSIANRV